MVTLCKQLTGSQKVVGSNPISSTNTSNTPNTSSEHLSTSPNSYTQLAIPLHRLIEGFLLSCRVENKSPKTLSFYKNNLEKFEWYLNKFGIKTIDASTIRSFLGYVKDTENRWDSTNARANRMVSPTTVKSYYISLSALFTWAMEEQLITSNPAATVKKPKLPNKSVKGCEPETIKILINEFNGKSFNDLRNKAMLLMFLDTGLRLSELAGLTLSDINIEKGIIKIIGKGNKERYARIGVKTQKALWNYLAHRPVEKEYVWLGKGHCKMTVDGIALVIRNLGKRLGIRLYPHKLRHSFAISFLRNGANPFELQIALGHTTLEMTRKYTQALGFDDVFKRHVLASPVDRLVR
jgi:site-specific recombinase XerD